MQFRRFVLPVLRATIISCTDLLLTIWVRDYSRFYRYMGTPVPQTLVISASLSHITLVIWVGVRVRVSGDVHITRVLVMGMPIYHSNTGSPTIHINRSIRLCLHYIYWIATAPARQPYRIGLLFTHKNLDFGQIPLKERNRSVPISKMERHISNMFCATLWCSVNRYSNRSESEQVGA